MRHIPARHIDYWTRAKWVCDGELHQHLSREAAVKCEANPNAKDSRGWSRDERPAKLRQYTAFVRG